MKFNEVFKAFKAGKGIYRVSNDPLDIGGVYKYYTQHCAFYDTYRDHVLVNRNTTHIFSVTDILADNWEVLDD
jgi:hypothetical protein